MDKFLIVLCGIIAYAIGNFSSAIFYSRLLEHEDVRKQGSGNAGAANMLRNYGTGMGLATFFTDFLKGVLAIGIAKLIGGDMCIAVAGVAVVVGHIWPVAFKFKGGKGVSTSIGVMFMLDWKATLFIFVVAVTIMFVSGYVSVASMAGFASAPFAIGFLYWGNKPIIIMTVIVSLLVIVSHHQNIARLLKGEEKKARWTKKGERGKSRVK